MKYEPYKNDKAADAGWLSALPETWEQIRGRFVMAVNPPACRARALEETDEVSFVPMEAVGEYGGLDLERTKPLDEIGAGYTAFEEGDVVVAKITPCFENGKGAIARGLKNGVGFGTTELHVLRTGKRLDKQFLFYLTISHTFRMLGESEMYGAGGQKRVPPEFAKDFRIPLPPVDEQQTIARFLDAKTAQIDALVAQKRQLIAKLKEKRSALIARTVTRGLPPEAAKAAGLEPNPEMKDSVVEWLGAVPLHWDVVRVKFVAKVESGHTPSRSEPSYWIEEECVIPWVSLNDSKFLKENDFISETAVKISEEGMRNSSAHLLPAGAVVFTRDATIGLTAITTVPAAVSQHVIAWLPGERVFAKYLLLVFKVMQNYLDSLTFGSTLKTIGMSDIRRITMPIPSMDEQQAITKYLDFEVSRIDALSDKIELAITRLTEYRQALITSAVTGKIDVGGLA